MDGEPKSLMDDYHREHPLDVEVAYRQPDEYNSSKRARRDLRSLIYTHWRKGLFFASGAVVFTFFFVLLTLLFFDVVPLPKLAAPVETTHTARGRFFLLSDLHVDPLYDPRLSEESFCRPPSSRQPTPSQAPLSPVVAPYGRYGCDSPPLLFESTLSAMRDVDANPDFILISGDFVGHGLPTWQMVNQTITNITEQIRKTFPNTLVLPVLGNNDVFPDYHQPYGPTDWTDYLAFLWSPWLREEQRNTFRAGGGYYSMLVPGTKTLRVIVLNTNFYSVEFIPSNDTSSDKPPTNLPNDPNAQFAWLYDQLSHARQTNEKVLIVGHIPFGINGFDGSATWHDEYVARYTDIIYQFTDVIMSQIFAHYHTDEFRIMQPKGGNAMKMSLHESHPAASTKGPAARQAEAVSSMMIHPSISPLHGNNPSFRYYHYHRQEPALTDYAHFYMDLTLANLFARPRWLLEYTFLSAYQVDALDTESYGAIWSSMADGSALERLVKYAQYKYVQRIDRLVPNLCALYEPTSDEYQRCLEQYNGQ